MHRPSERSKTMKLPTAESKGLPLKSAKAQDAKPKSVSPFKQLVRKLSGSSRPKSIRTEEAQSSVASNVDVNGIKLPFIKKSKGIRVAFTLLLVRPWVLVLGFWIFSMLGAAMALEGMISPRKLTTALPEPTQIEPVRSSSLINVEQGESGDVDTGDIALEKATIDEPIVSTADGELAANSSNFPIWTLGGVVGTCAAGCLVMSRRRAMARLAVARSRGRVRRMRKGAVPIVALNGVDSRVGQKTLVRKPSASVGNSPVAKRSRSVTAPGATAKAARPVSGSKPSLKPAMAKSARAKKRRQRNSRGSVAAQLAPQKGIPSRSSRTQVLASRSTAKPSAIAHPSQPRSTRRSPSRMARRQSVVSVVPASESHALDWQNGSLAHQVDVRPQRAAM